MKTLTKPSKLTLDTAVTALFGVGEQVAAKLKRLGISTIRDLLWHLPYRYDDFSAVVPIAAVRRGAKVTINGTIASIAFRPTRRRNLTVTEALVTDPSGTLRIVWFNQPFVAEKIRPGAALTLSGRVSFDKRGLALNNPTFEFAGSKASVHTGRLVPVYPETFGLTSRWLRSRIKSLLFLTHQVVDSLPPAIRHDQNLPELAVALQQVHFPGSMVEAQAAKRRLAFDELLLLQLKVRQARRALSQATARPLAFQAPLIQAFVAQLPFKLTKSQRRAAWEILKDMARPFPMNRLLEGDVGSGKTVVAAMAALQAAAHDALTLFLVPTEILAEQHAGSFRRLLAAARQSVGLLTQTYSLIDGAPVSREDFQSAAQQGKLHIIIGTQALLEPKAGLPAPALVIVDEQHRFGVRQRSQLLTGPAREHAHLLSMTATPIPRTLALTVYGTLDISALTEFPKGLRRVLTKVIAPKGRVQAYEIIRRQVAAGDQAFIVCPLIDESEHMAARAVVKEYERLRATEFKELNVGLLHGQMKAQEKERMMADFAANRISVLISTSVIEVGIDMPNAALMIIESAERFGLAQLHQLRGRIGRGDKSGFCFLFSEAGDKSALQRLKAFAATTDGFALAEEDLKIRGPGEFTGVRQSGLPDIAMAYAADHELVRQAQAAADQLLREDQALSRYPLLRQALKAKYENIVLA